MSEIIHFFNSSNWPLLLLIIKKAACCNRNIIEFQIQLNSPWGLKLKSGGRGRPFGRRVFGSLNSSKKGWMQASNCSTNVEKQLCFRAKETQKRKEKKRVKKQLTAVHRKLGEYWKNLQTRSTVSGGKCFWNTWKDKDKSHWG